MKSKGNGLMAKGTYSNKKCVYCGKELGHDATKDHVPPRFIYKDFKNEILENRHTVPCCLDCNQRYSTVEEKLNPLFQQIYNGATSDELNECHKNDFRNLMVKIALGYRYIETSKYFNCIKDPKVTYFFKKDADGKQVQEFRKITGSDYIEDISSNSKEAGVLIFMDNDLSGATPTNIASEFWHEYNVNYDYVRMSFYDTLFVQVEF